MRPILILIFVMFISCLLSKLVSGRYLIRKGEASYKVYKIDSINTYYLIYAQKGDPLYKVVSKKTVVVDCDRIKVHMSYEFKLHSILSSLHIGGIRIESQNLDLVKCFSYDDSTRICLEGDSIRELYYADNIKGLCFIEE